MYVEVEERVEQLEDLLGQFIVQTNLSFRRLQREMRAFKDEMKDFKNEMRDFKGEMKDFKDEMKDFKDEMKDFKGEMKDFKDEVRREQKEMKQQWGSLANKMGTLVEDIIAPGVRPVVKKYFHCDIEHFAVNVKRKRKAVNLAGEYDVIAVSETDQVFLVEVKSAPKPEHLNEFAQKLDTFQRLFPEYADKRLIPILGSLRFDEDMFATATQRGMYLMAYREWEFLDLLNFDAIQNP